MIRATSWQLFSFISLITTEAPSLAKPIAIAFPIPCPAPVTIAILFSSLKENPPFKKTMIFLNL